MTNIPGAGCNKRYSSKSAGCSEKARTRKMPQEREKTNMNQHFICMIYPVAVNGCGGENIFSDLWQLPSACVSANEQQSPPTNSLRDGRGGRGKKKRKERIGTTIKHTHTSSHSNPNHGYANGGATSNRLQRSKHTISAQSKKSAFPIKS